MNQNRCRRSRLSLQFEVEIWRELPSCFVFAAIHENKRRRESGENPNSCALHDHCDANELMIAAFRKVFGREPDPRLESDCEKINRAWNQWQSDSIAAC